MRQYFQQPKFAKVGKLFQDIPLEAIERSAEGLNKEYETNLTEFNKLDSTFAAMQVAAGDDPEKQAKIQAMRDKMQAFAESDGFENARGFVGRLTADTLNDKELSAMQMNYKRQLEDEETARKLQAQGFGVIDASLLRNGENFQTVSVDEEGNRKINDYQSSIVKQADYVKAMEGLYDNIPQGGGTRYVPMPDGSMKEITFTGIKEDDIRTYTEHAMGTYKGTEEYANQKLLLQTQGIEGEAADQIIKQQMLGVGMERVGGREQSRLLGYENPNKTAARAAAAKAKAAEEQRKTPRFVQQSGSMENDDKNGILGRVWGSDKARLHTNGYSTEYVNSDIKAVNLNEFYKIEKGNSETDFFFGGDDAAKIKKEAMVANLSQQPHQQVFVDAATGELFITGEGSPLAHNVPDGEKPRLENGRYIAQDEDGNAIHLKLRNMKTYLDPESGDTFFVPMNRDEEYRGFGAQGAVNSLPIDFGADSGNGGRFVDNYDRNYIQGTIHQMDPGKAISSITPKIRQMMSSGNPDHQAIIQDLTPYLDGSQPISQMPYRIMNLMDEQGIKSIESPKNGRSTQVASRKGAILGELLNIMVATYEDANTHKYMPKEESSVNMIGYDRNSAGSPIE